MSRQQIKRTVRSFFMIGLALFYGLSHAPLVSAAALSQDQIRVLNLGIKNYNTEIEDVSCGTSAYQAVSGVTDQELSLTDKQVANINAVIGIAKTMNLGEQGALIGVMAAYTESKFKNYANTGVPISISNPKKEAEGKDHDSLGIMQQRIGSNWSTISSSPSDAQAVDQLMTPAYNAQAFFGSPANATFGADVKSPTALKKGLLNRVADYATADPAVAAQKVQASAFSDGSNYRSNTTIAQKIVAKYYSTAAAIPLVVSYTGGTGNTTTVSTATAGTCSGSGGAATGTALAAVQLALSLSWADGPHGPHSPKPEYASAVRQYNPTASPTRADCGVFVATVLHGSNADPNYPAVGTAVQKSYLAAHPEKYQSIPNTGNTSNLQPGDIFVLNSGGIGHTFIYVGDQPNGKNIAQASLDDEMPYQSTVVFKDGRGQYQIYRLKQ